MYVLTATTILLSFCNVHKEELKIMFMTCLNTRERGESYDKRWGNRRKKSTTEHEENECPTNFAF